MSKLTIAEVLAKMDPKNDAHWTNDGLPRLDILSKAVGRDVTRDELNLSHPSFNRVSATENGSAKAVELSKDGTAPSAQSTDEMPPAPPEHVESVQGDIDTREDIERARAELSDAIAKRAKLDAEISRLQNIVAAIQHKAEDHGFSDTISAYKAAQNEARRSQAALIAEMRESGALATMELAQKAIMRPPVDTGARRSR